MGRCNKRTCKQIKLAAVLLLSATITGFAGKAAFAAETRLINWSVGADGSWYFFGADGNVQTGWLEWKNQKYFLGENGVMQEGFVSTAEGIYYFRPGNGDMLTGIQIIDWVPYNFGEDGRLMTGWQIYNGRSYFYDPVTGRAAVGTVLIDGKQYHFTADGVLDMGFMPWNYMLVNYQNSMPEGFSVALTKVNGWYVDSRMAEALTEMIKAAKADGVTLRMTSTYRTLATQTRLYNNAIKKRVKAGMSQEDAVREANLYNAQPGKSEHNLGLAIDFIQGSELNDAFAYTASGKWLGLHAHEYGFILRYKSEKTDITHIAYEPWHFRYVGVEEATYMYENDICFEEFFPNYYTVYVTYDNADAAGSTEDRKEQVPEVSASTEQTTAAAAEVPYYDKAGYGWKKEADGWFYYDKEGQKAVNWLLDADNNWYFMNADGIMQTGFIEWKGQKYYLNKSGVMQTGWQEIDGSAYYFRPDNGDMFVGTHIIDGAEYGFYIDGRLIME